jgi:hypothetical protein
MYYDQIRWGDDWKRVLDPLAFKHLHYRGIDTSKGDRTREILVPSVAAQMGGMVCAYFGLSGQRYETPVMGCACQMAEWEGPVNAHLGQMFHKR